MILLDTSVLVYAAGADHELATPARKLILAIGSGELRAHTTPEVIQEFAHVRARRRDRADAIALAQAYAALLAPLHVVTPQHVLAGLDIWQAAPSLGAFDSVLAAVAMSVDAELVSSDRAFATVPGLSYRSITDFA